MNIITAFNLALARIAPLGYRKCVEWSLPTVLLYQSVALRERSSAEGGTGRSAERRPAYLLKQHRRAIDPDFLDARARRLYSKRVYNEIYRDRRRLARQRQLALGLES